jgi:hypothetical protein
MAFNKNGVASGLAYNSGTILLGIVSVIGRLFMGLLMLAGKIAILEGGPRTLEAARWLKEKTLVFFVKSCSFIKPYIAKAGKIIISLLVIALRKLNMRTISRIETYGRLVYGECAKSIKKYKIKITQKNNNESSEKLSTGKRERDVSLKNLTLDQTVYHDKEFTNNRELDMLEN